MKKTLSLPLRIVAVLAVCGVLLARGLNAADVSVADRFEYVTLRWAGRDNTHIIRPSGNVEFLGPQFVKIKRPERADDRSFYMNIAMNALAKEGYELVAMTSDDYVMKRRVIK
jgi:hypothetical protein